MGAYHYHVSFTDWEIEEKVLYVIKGLKQLCCPSTTSPFPPLEIQHRVNSPRRAHLLGISHLHTQQPVIWIDQLIWFVNKLDQNQLRNWGLPDNFRRWSLALLALLQQPVVQQHYGRLVVFAHLNCPTLLFSHKLWTHPTDNEHALQ